VSAATDAAVDPLTIPPQPSPDVDSAEFWQRTAEGRLAMCRCSACGEWHQRPLERCRRCAEPTEFADVSGKGIVYSFIVVRRPVSPGYLDKVPYVIALVELPEQRSLRLPTRIVDVDPSAVYVGMPVEVRFDPLPGGDFVVPVFVPS
jgi:uncharacterized OB-fold protein